MSVIERMNCDEAALSDGADPEGAITTLYRPKNVIAFLAANAVLIDLKKAD